MRQTIGLILFFAFLSVIFVEPVRDSLNNWFRRHEIAEERVLGEAIPYKQHIKNIQLTLSKSGFDAGSPDGTMGEKTRDALRLFQRQRGLKVTGWLDVPTLEAIEKDARVHKELARKELYRQIHAQFAPVPGAQEPVQPEGVNVSVQAPVEPEKRGTSLVEPKETQPRKPSYDTKQIQAALTKAGLYKGKLDGKIGKQTRSAIKAFQKKNKLKIDGVVGEKTWTMLKKYL